MKLSKKGIKSLEDGMIYEPPSEWEFDQDDFEDSVVLTEDEALRVLKDFYWLLKEVLDQFPDRDDLDFERETAEFLEKRIEQVKSK